MKSFWILKIFFWIFLQAFLYIAKHPAVQARVQAELDNVVGRARLPAYSDLKRMPYTQAAIFESQRLSSIAPLGLPHRAVEDTELCGYFIPKDTWIFTNIWHAHHDANIWEKPHTFRPERFLSADGKDLVTPKDFIPFSVGECKISQSIKQSINQSITR